MTLPSSARACLVVGTGTRLFRARWRTSAGLSGTSERMSGLALLSFARQRRTPHCEMASGSQDASIIAAGCSRGRGWCTALPRPMVDLWRTFWDICDDVSGGMVELYKVKAHASMRDVADELPTWTDRAGNDAADGRALHNSASRQAHYCTHSSP